MKDNTHLLRMIFLAVLVAVGVVISPILRVEGMCPMAHLINITCSVFMGPWYSLLCATLIGIIRMATMGIPPLALTGAVFGAFLSGVLYRASGGKLIFAVIGEVFGTGIVGAIISYPVMTLLWGYKGLTWMFYVPSFIMGTLIGGSLAFIFLKKLSASGALQRIQKALKTNTYEADTSVGSSAITIAALGVIAFMALKVLSGSLSPEAAFWPFATYGSLGIFLLAAVVYYLVKNNQKGKPAPAAATPIASEAAAAEVTAAEETASVPPAAEVTAAEETASVPPAAEETVPEKAKPE